MWTQSWGYVFPHCCSHVERIVKRDLLVIYQFFFYDIIVNRIGVLYGHGVYRWLKWIVCVLYTRKIKVFLRKEKKNLEEKLTTFTNSWNETYPDPFGSADNRARSYSNSRLLRGTCDWNSDDFKATKKSFTGISPKPSGSN